MTESSIWDWGGGGAESSSWGAGSLLSGCPFLGGQALALPSDPSPPSFLDLSVQKGCRTCREGRPDASPSLLALPERSAREPCRLEVGVAKLAMGLLSLQSSARVLGKGKWGFLLIMTGVGLPRKVPTFICLGLSCLPLPWVLQAQTPISRGLEAPAEEWDGGSWA